MDRPEKLRYFVLRRRQRDKLREIARESLVAWDGDQKRAIGMAKARVEQQAAFGDADPSEGIITTILLGVALQLVIDLIVYWVKEQLFEPSQNYQAGEPGYEDA